MDSIFLSYRRQDSADITGRVRYDLVENFGEKQVFNDVYSVRKGQNFRDAVADAILRCKVYLVVIGPTWATIKDEKGKPRLENEDDNVRVEMEIALNRKQLPLIPLFVGGSQMPHKQDLPESLQPIVDYNGMRIGTGPDYDRDISDLVKEIERHGVTKIAVPPIQKKQKPAALTIAMTIFLLIASATVVYKTAFQNGELSQPISGGEIALPPHDNENAGNGDLGRASPTTIREIQAALNGMNFVAGIEDGRVGSGTRAAISAFERTFGVPVTGIASNQLLRQLHSASASGLSNVTCSTETRPSERCNPVSKTRSVPTTETDEDYMSERVPCYYPIWEFCNQFDCNWAGIVNRCENDPIGLQKLQQECSAQHNGSLVDYGADCSCSRTSCYCDISGDCEYSIQTTKTETYTVTECEMVTTTEEKCSCKAPEVCPTYIR